MKKMIKYYVLLFLVLLFPFSVFASEEKVTLYFFHGNGCPHCAEEEVFLKELQEKYPDIIIERYEVWYNNRNAELLEKVETAFQVTRSGVPTNVIGDTIIMGYSDSIGNQIERAIQYYQENEYVDVIDKIKKAGIYVIGRIVVFNDSHYAKDHPEDCISNRCGI